MPALTIAPLPGLALWLGGIILGAAALLLVMGFFRWRIGKARPSGGKPDYTGQMMIAVSIVMAIIGAMFVVAVNYGDAQVPSVSTPSPEKKLEPREQM